MGHCGIFRRFNLETTGEFKMDFSASGAQEGTLGAIAFDFQK
jgi:hypothetical protein